MKWFECRSVKKAFRWRGVKMERGERVMGEGEAF